MQNDHFLRDLFIKLDIFGKKPLLRIHKNESFRTFFGSLLTIMSVLLMVCTFGYFSLGLWDTTHPSIILSITNIFNPPEFKLSSKNFGIAFGLQNPFTYDQFIDESIYSVEVYQKFANRSTTGNDTVFKLTVSKIETEPCDKTKFPDSYQSLISYFPLKDMYCLKDTNFSIFGTFLNPTHSFLYIEIFECKNNTLLNKTNCKPKTEIDKLLAGTFFSFSYTDIIISPGNYTDPNQKYMGFLHNRE